MVCALFLSPCCHSPSAPKQSWDEAFWCHCWIVVGICTSLEVYP